MNKPIWAFATKGTDTNEERRLRTLLSGVETEFITFDKSKKLGSFKHLIRSFSQSRKRLIVMEGTGIAGGIACLIARILWGHRYVVSSGDAVGPFVGSHSRLAGPIFAVYERILCRMASGYIGWTPYLVGRALTFGVGRAMTASGWVLGDDVKNMDTRTNIRTHWNVPPEAIVFGIAGAIVWSKRRKYCYGLELVRAIRRVKRRDVVVVIIGNGSGIPHLEAEAGDSLGTKVFLPGAVPLDCVMENLRAMDVGSLPQSTDGVGAFRYTTKISEYAQAQLPVVTNQIPAAYDLDHGQIWRLPGSSPWDTKFEEAMVALMENITQDAIRSARSAYENYSDQTFCKSTQVERTGHFLLELVAHLGLDD